jgi:hypothetical protein
MQGFFDFTEQTEIVKREKRKHLEARQDWQRAPKIIVTEEYIALDKKALAIFMFFVVILGCAGHGDYEYAKSKEVKMCK